MASQSLLLHPFEFFPYVIERIVLHIRHFIWKRGAAHAMRAAITETCGVCGGSIVPGHWVTCEEAFGVRGHVVLIHAGHQFGFNSLDLYCAPKESRIGTWDGYRVTVHDDFLINNPGSTELLQRYYRRRQLK